MDEKIAEFISVTQAPVDVAMSYVSMSNGNVELALESFFARQAGGDQVEPESEPAATDSFNGGPTDLASQLGGPSSRATSTTSVSSSRPRFQTFQDLIRSTSQTPSPSPSPLPRGRGTGKESEDFFTGGEKSGLAVQNPNFPGSGGGDGNSLVDRILRQAQTSHARGGDGQDDDDDDDDEDDQDDQDSKSYSLKKKAKKVNTFTGSGYVLGDEESPSRVIPDLNAAATASGSFAQARAIRTETVVRHLTFWRDGFTIEDGPLFRYDDPANQQHLKAIDSGHAPLSLLNVVPGQKVDVHVAKKTDEDYKPPKRVVGGYSGSGFRLGSPVPGETFSSPAASTATPTSVSAASTSSDLGTTGDARLQIRLGNGQRLTARFDSNDLIDVIYNYVSANDASNGRAYVLQTTFPNKELTDRQISIKQAGVAGAVLVQKWL